MSYKKESSTNAINEDFLDDRCTLNKVVRIIGKRWVSEILLLIKNDINRFSEMKRCLTGISDNVLSTALNDLVRSGLIEKKIFQQVPLKVEYHITSSGASLTAIMQNLCSWGKENIAYEVRIVPSYNKVKL